MTTQDLSIARYIHIAIPYAPNYDEYHLITFSDGMMDELESEPDFQIPNFDSENLIMNFTIDLQTGKVLDWQRDEFLRIWGKICDEGTYTLLDADHTPITQITGYVPIVSILPSNKDGAIILNSPSNPMAPSTIGPLLLTSPSFSKKVTPHVPSAPTSIARPPKPFSPSISIT